MRIQYSSESDILLIELNEGQPVDSRDISEGVVVHLDEEGTPLEIEILDASRSGKIETGLSIPVEQTAA